MRYGRLFSFVLFIIGFGLLQLWVLIIVLYVNTKPINISHLLGDGGLFFFSTSLAFNSLLSLVSNRNIEFGSLSFNITLLIVVPMTLLSVVVYSSVLSSALGHVGAPFSQHIFAQIVCALAALAYSFYVATTTNLFRAPR